jgi:glycogen operon protein
VTEPGSTAQLLGATLRDGGASFSVYSRDAARLELLLFDAVDDARPARMTVIYLRPPRRL